MSIDYDDDKWGQQRTNFLFHHMYVAAEKLGVTVIENPTFDDLTFTGEMRSVGIRAHDGTREVWMRTAMDDPDARQICRWGGNVEANIFNDNVPKPEVFKWAEWYDPDWEEPQWENERGIRVRAEVGTYVSDGPVSHDGDIYDDPKLPDSWWDALRHALVAIQQHAVPKDNFAWRPEDTAEDVERFFATTLSMEVFSSISWATAHRDLHWVNITGPHLWLLDWETWGLAPAWYDAATIYCNSLHHPPTARRIRKLFPELDSHSGTVAQLAIIGRYLRMLGETEVTEPIRTLGKELVARLSTFN